jgi:hypothetical protein
LVVNVPQKQIVVSREHPLHHSHEDIFVAVHHVFEEAGRQQEYALKQYGDVRTTPSCPMGWYRNYFLKRDTVLFRALAVAKSTFTGTACSMDLRISS